MVVKATTGTKTAAKKTTRAKSTPVHKTEEVEVVVEPLQSEDLVPCLNVYPGSLLVFGRKSHVMYSFDATNSVEYIMYGDLKSEALNRRSKLIYEPQIIIQDERFLNEFPRLKEVYNDNYSASKLEDLILKSSVKVMKETIKGLPEITKERCKTVASTLIENQELDSMTKITALDELLGTELASIAGQ